MNSRPTGPDPATRRGGSGLAGGFLVVGLCLTMVASAACTGTEPSSTSQSDGRPMSSSAPEDESDAEGPPTLAELLGVAGTPEEVAQRISSTEHTRQELIRQCMARQGFEYIPYVTAGQQVSTTGLPTNLPPDQFRRQYGYGIATGFENALTLDSVEPPPDPNLAIVEAMSESERAAYDRALHGTGGGDGSSGCAGEATDATDRFAPVIEEFGDDLADLSARVEADTRVVAAQRAWADCLADAGYRYSDEASIVDDMIRRMNPLYESIQGRELPEGVGYVFRDLTLTAEQRAILAGVRGYELAVANADQDCRDETEIDQVRSDVRDEYDAEFVAEHRGRLRELFPDADL